MFRSVPVTAASVRRHAANAELVDIYTEMTAIESRTGGRPIREHRNDIRRRLDGLATDVATLPDEPETRQLRIDIGAAKALAALPETSSADGDARLERLIGAIQNYDDDV